MARMARNLHDGPLQDVFATMLRLDALAHRVPPEIVNELQTLSSLQQKIIRSLREVCRGGDGVDDRRLPSEILAATIADAALGLGFQPVYRIDPSIDHLDDRQIVSDLALATRECLSNIARHAHATMVDVTVDSTRHEIRLVVADNGCGIAPDARRGNGLGNLRSRAERNGGSCIFSQRRGGGTLVDWRVPRSTERVQYGSTGGPDGSSWRSRVAAV